MDETNSVVVNNCAVGEIVISCDTGTQTSHDGKWTTSWNQRVNINRVTGLFVGSFFWTKVEVESEWGTSIVETIDTYAKCEAAKIKPLF
jgi:hypothetical protein